MGLPTVIAQHGLSGGNVRSEHLVDDSTQSAERVELMTNGTTQYDTLQQNRKSEQLTAWKRFTEQYYFLQKYEID
jgi:hypothetical protein